MRRLSLVLACTSALLAIAPAADAQAVPVSAAATDVDRAAAGPIRIAAPVPAEATLRVVADSAPAAALGGRAKAVRVNADIYELSRHMGVGMAVGAVAGLIVGAIVEDENGLYAAPLLILYTAGGGAVGMVGGAVVYFARGGRT